MADSDPTNHVFIDRTVEAVIRIAVIAALVGWCFIIAKPFLAPILGGAIIAVTVFQGYMLEAALGGRRFAAAVLVTLFMLVMLVVPSVPLGDSLVTGVNKLVDSFQSGQLSIPTPPDSVARWPVIGEPIARFWTLASQDLSQAFRQAGPLLSHFGPWLLSAAQGAGIALLQLVLAILGRGVGIPTSVIFVGAIGGFPSSGIIGLFLGAVVLALGYNLFLAWLKQADTQSAS